MNDNKEIKEFLKYMNSRKNEKLFLQFKSQGCEIKMAMENFDVIELSDTIILVDNYGEKAFKLSKEKLLLSKINEDKVELLANDGSVIIS